MQFLTSAPNFRGVSWPPWPGLPEPLVFKYRGTLYSVKKTCHCYVPGKDYTTWTLSLTITLTVTQTLTLTHYFYKITSIHWWFWSSRVKHVTCARYGALQWSYGVTLWELMTLGQQPYADVDPFEMVTYLLHGYRMCQPVHCPNELWGIFFICSLLILFLKIIIIIINFSISIFAIIWQT